jgi:hypothetical protein
MHVRLGKWIIADRDSHVGNISDAQAISRASSQSFNSNDKNMRLVAITPEGEKVWTLEEEIKEMRGHLRGFIRSKYGREMLDAHKLAIAHDIQRGRL